MVSARGLYRLHLGLALLGAGAVLAAVIVALTRITPGLPPAGELLAACRQIVPLESGPGLLLIVLLFSLGLVVALLGVRSFRRQLHAQRHFLRALRPVEQAAIDGVAVTMIESDRPQAFCAGLLRPQVYVSTASLTLLTPIELSAVVAHEAHHRAIRDPLRILAARVLADAFFFLPALRRLSERYRQLAELAADEAAAEARGPSALASALLRFGERGGAAAPVVGIAPERVERLLGREPRWQLPLSIFSGSLVILAGLLGLVLTAPALIQSESLSLAMILAESCMVAMIVAPLAIAGSALWLSRSWVHRRLSLR
ncbi:MAG: M56 family metallopeptidase [Solirubrobacterales bacterium]